MVSDSNSVNATFNYLQYSDRSVPVTVQQADSLGIAEKKIVYTTSIFNQHKLKPVNGFALKERMVSDTGWLFIYLLITLFFTSIISQLYRRRFVITINAIWQNRYFNQISGETKMFDHPLNFILFTLYSANISFFITLAIQFYFPKQIQINTVLSFVTITGLIMLYSTIKSGIAIFTAKLFKQDEFSTRYITQLHLSENNLGILMLPFLWVLLYHPYGIYFIIILSAIALLSLFRLVKTFITLTMNTRLSAYQIFLYLCTVEILPIIVLVKYASLRI